MVLDKEEQTSECYDHLTVRMNYKNVKKTCLDIFKKDIWITNNHMNIDSISLITKMQMRI
jgi:hypothetical protein